MKKYRLNLYVLGLDEAYLDQIDDQQFVVQRKGDIWNKRTGKQYEENIVKKRMYTTYEKGFHSVVDEIITFIEENSIFSKLLCHAREISLQICVDLDEENRVPYIRFSPKQLAFFAKINAEIDFQIS